MVSYVELQLTKEKKNVCFFFFSLKLNLCSVEDTFKKEKRQVQSRIKVFANSI